MTQSPSTAVMYIKVYNSERWGRRVTVIFYKISYKIAMLHLKRSYMAVKLFVLNTGITSTWYQMINGSLICASWCKQILQESAVESGFPNLELLCSLFSSSCFRNNTLETVVRVRNPHGPYRSILIFLLILLANALDTILLSCIRLCSGFVFAWGMCK